MSSQPMVCSAALHWTYAWYQKLQVRTQVHMLRALRHVAGT